MHLSTFKKRKHSFKRKLHFCETNHIQGGGVEGGGGGVEGGNLPTDVQKYSSATSLAEIAAMDCISHWF